jgi:hypothetical protein
MKIFLPILLLLPLIPFGQSRIGGWKAHVSFTPVIAVAETPEAIAGATAGGIFLTEKNGLQITTKTKSEGLSEVGISAIAYSAGTGFLLIGYESGNLDLLKNDHITNLPDLTRKTELPDKTIHRIVCEGSFAYLCCAFGIVKIDIQKAEVAETWDLGPNNDLDAVFDLTTFNNYWYAATNRGIFRAAMAGSNLQDYRNWQLQTALPQPDAAFSSFVQYDGLLFTHDSSNDRILAFIGTSWQQQFAAIKNIRCIRNSPAGLIVVTTEEVWLTSKSGNMEITGYQPGSTSPIDPRDALTDSNGNLWIGDHRFGLTQKTGTGTFRHFVPDSPGSDQISALKTGAEEIYVATVVNNQAGIPEAGISILQNGSWQNFSGADDTGLQSIKPITSFALNSDHPDEYWASTSGSGLLYFQKNRVAAHYNEQNSALGALNGTCVVNGLAPDAQKNLLYTNPTGKTRIGVRSADGTFVQLSYPGMGFSSSPTGEIIVSSTATNWTVLPDEGLFAFKIKGSTENISDDQYRKVAVQSRFSNGSSAIVTNFGGISTAVEDLSHQLWVGTSTGIVVYGNPEKVFESGEFYGIQPSLDDGEGLFKPILAKEKISAIAVDGGNRKWCGTANSGVFLFTENGDHLLQHFDSNNSPLLADQIVSIGISTKSGEVFFATSKGLISFKSDASASQSNFEKAYVWPNPMRETYTGNVSIDGLTDGTDIRITDVSGNLVYRTTSLGGRAVWNGQNARGVRVSTGVYLILCSSATLNATKIIKLLVIH